MIPDENTIEIRAELINLIQNLNKKEKLLRKFNY